MAPSTSTAVRAMTVEAARHPLRWPRLPSAATPQVRHQPWSGSMGAPHDAHVRTASGLLGGSCCGGSCGVCGPTSGASVGSAWSSFTPSGLHTPPRTAPACSAARDLDAQRGAVHARAVDRLDHALGLAARHAQEREALEHAHVAYRLAV